MFNGLIILLFLLFIMVLLFIWKSLMKVSTLRLPFCRYLESYVSGVIVSLIVGLGDVGRYSWHTAGGLR